MGDAELLSCKYEVDPSDASGASGVLEVTRANRLPSLQRLAEALVPAGKPLTALRLQSCQLGAAALQGCSALRGLDSLLLLDNRSEVAALEQLLQQAPRLKELVLHNGFASGSSLAPCLVSRQGLESLTLIGGVLHELPPGPYLSSEHSASLHGLCST